MMFFFVYVVTRQGRYVLHTKLNTTPLFNIRIILYVVSSETVATSPNHAWKKLFREKPVSFAPYCNYNPTTHMLANLSLSLSHSRYFSLSLWLSHRAGKCDACNLPVYIRK